MKKEKKKELLKNAIKKMIVIFKNETLKITRPRIHEQRFNVTKIPNLRYIAACAI